MSAALTTASRRSRAAWCARLRADWRSGARRVTSPRASGSRRTNEPQKTRSAVRAAAMSRRRAADRTSPAPSKRRKRTEPLMLRAARTLHTADTKLRSSSVERMLFQARSAGSCEPPAFKRRRLSAWARSGRSSASKSSSTIANCPVPERGMIRVHHARSHPAESDRKTSDWRADGDREERRAANAILVPGTRSGMAIGRERKMPGRGVCADDALSRSDGEPPRNMAGRRSPAVSTAEASHSGEAAKLNSAMLQSYCGPEKVRRIASPTVIFSHAPTSLE
mmetsp:Transcript_10011/g.31541  ORF Transcript_10011/g.31541 Transcript_10011/m.31541 type:complete len:280 (-) Transcript_10011:258-1097(-)